MPDTLPMKILTVVSVAIVVVDLEVLRKTFTEYFQLKQVLENDPYQQCYKPQAQLRIVFQCYAIYAALVCTALTSMLAINCTDQFVEMVARLVINLCFMVFGPILLTFVNYGFVHFKQLSFICTPRGASHHINFIDIILLLGCFVLALCVTFTMAMQKTLDMAQQSFQDESSLIYRLTSMYFSYQVRQSQERDRQQLRMRAEERREQRRQRQAERAQVLTAFQREHPEITTMGRPGATGGPCERVGAPSTASQASTVALNVASGAPSTTGLGIQRTLVGNNMPLRANNRDLGNVESGLGTGILHSGQNNNDDHLLEEDFDDEMMIGGGLGGIRASTGGGINQRVTNYEYAQMQEDKQQMRDFRNNMPETQIINSYKTLNQQLAVGDAAKKQREAQFAKQQVYGSTNNNGSSTNELSRQVNSGSFRMQDNVINSVRNANIGENLFMVSENGMNMQELKEIVRDDEDETEEVGEQLIKDTKTMSGTSTSQASTNFQTNLGSQVSTGGAVAVSSLSNGNNNQQQQQQVQGVQAAGAVPPSNHRALSVLNEENTSELAFQSLDGGAANGDKKDGDDESDPVSNAWENQSNHSFRSKNGKQKKEKKE